MPTIHLTKQNIDNIPLTTGGRQVLYHDSKLKGFGLRVSTNTKSFFVQRTVSGRTVRATIGQLGIFTPEQARKEAIGLLADMTKGVNPNKTKRDKKVKITTFQNAFDSRVSAKQDKLSPRTVSDYKAVVDCHLSDWKNRSLEDITKQMVIRRYGELSKYRGPTVATKVMRIFSVTYNYARFLNEDLPENPVVILSFTKSWHKPLRRQRVIKSHQMKAWYEAVMSEPNEIVRDYILFMFFTGLRRSEAARLKWKDVDFIGQTMTITETKNGHPLVLPLMKFTYELLGRRYADRINEYVFYGTGKSGHLQDPRKAIRRIIKLSEVKFSSHDLRRTFITTAERLDLSVYTVKSLVNHRIDTDLTGGYIVFDVDRFREPVKKIENILISMINSDGQISSPQA